MTGEDIIRYLQAHPEFFDQHAEALLQIRVPHPREGQAIPLSERQLLQLRDRNRVLEAKLRELVSFGEENDAIGERLHRATLAMIRAADFEEVLRVVYYHLREDFAVPHVALRLWGRVPAHPIAEYSPVSDEARAFAESLLHPYCVHKPMFDSLAWFGESDAELRSFAYVALREGDCNGVLALASEDAGRFYPEMGTLYLARLAEVIGATLAGRLR